MLRFVFAAALLTAAAVRAETPQAARVRKAHEVLATATGNMTDRAGVGEELLTYLRGVPGASVEVREGQNGVVELEEISADIPVRRIVFSPLIAGASPRYVGLLIAEKAADLKLEEFPDSAEKDFMKDSLMARTWLELGGVRAKLPYFDGVRDERRAGIIEAWVSSNLDGYVRDQAAKGRPSLKAMIAAKKMSENYSRSRSESILNEIRGGRSQGDECIALHETGKLVIDAEKLKAERERLEAYQKEAKEFSSKETEWFYENQGMVR
jgi:hypothetical protein